MKIIPYNNYTLKLPDAFCNPTAIVTGSGFDLQPIMHDIVLRKPYAELREMPLPTTPGHQGELIVGYIDDTPVMLWSGRVHFYEGYAPSQICQFVGRSAYQGCLRIIMLNAAGGLTIDTKPGTMLIHDDIINMINPMPGEYISGNRGTNLAVKLRSEFEEEPGFKFGVYLAVPGPCYETRAEVTYYSRMADCIGMSCAIEHQMALAMDMEVLSASWISNNSYLQPGPTDHKEVLEAGKGATDPACELIRAAIKL